MKQWSKWLALLAVLAMVVAACGDGDDGADDTADGGADTTAATDDGADDTADDGDGEDAGGEGAGENIGEVSAFGAFSGVEAEAVNQVIEEQINTEADYTASYEGSDAFEQQIQIQIEGGAPPDVAIWPQPGAVIDQAEQGNLVSLEDLGFDIAELEAIFGEYLVSLGEYEGQHYGVPTNVNFKSAVWYNVPAFEEAGYEVPETWEELLALSDQIVADGSTPWCIGLGSDAATGWPGTDWMEDIVLRSAGTEVYDGWVANEVAFTDDPIVEAAELFGEILHTEGYVLGGAAQVPSIDFRDAPDPMFNEPPDCYLHRQATFITNFFPEGVAPVEDYNFFPFPDIEGNSGALIAGEMAAVLNNRPEVLDFVQRFVSEEAQCAQGSIEGIARISPNVNVGPDCYRDEIIGQASETITTALSEGTARFDASDLMPPAVGSGTFWQAMIDYSTGGPDAVESAMETAQSGYDQ